MSHANDDELLLEHLDGLLGADAERDLAERLKNEPALCELLMTLSRQESALGEWAKTDRSATGIDAELAAGGAPAPRDRMRPFRALTALVFLLVPPVGLALSGWLWSDYSLALPGWVLSTEHVVQFTSRILAGLLGLSWLGTWRLGWLKRPHACGIAGAVSLLISTAASSRIQSSYAEDEILRREEFIQSHRWISYDSVYYWPKDQEKLTKRPAQEPTDAQALQELEVLKRAGFTGVFIHECRAGQVNIAKLARQAGFTAVIQGVRIADAKHLDAAPTQLQLRNALSVSAYVDAYVIGELSAREVNLASLKVELARLRKSTGKPVTTSFLHEDYIGKRGDRLRELEDFTVRALARPWQGNDADPIRAARAVQEALDTLRHDDKPSLLTTIFYPAGGAPSFTDEKQFAFFEQVLKLKVPRGVALVHFSSFDRPWAKKLSEVTDYTPAFEGHTGLFGVRFSDDEKKVEFIERKALHLFKPAVPKQSQQNPIHPPGDDPMNLKKMLAAFLSPKETAPARRPSGSTRPMVCESLEDRLALSGYSTQFVGDAQTGNHEYRTRLDDYQFGAFVLTPQGALSYRGKPDAVEGNGYGDTEYANVFIAGPNIGPTGGTINSVNATPTGIHLIGSGSVPSPGGNAGSWMWDAEASFDRANQLVHVVGTISVHLSSTLSGSMNVGKIASNFLFDYPLNIGGRGQTGDMQSADFIYGDGHQIHFAPAPGSEGTFPTDESTVVTVLVNGEINRSDPNVTEIRKPTLRRTLTSTDPGTTLIAGALWISSQVGFQFDNVGLGQIVEPQNTSAVDFQFQVNSVWSIPPLPTYPVVLEAETMKATPTSAGAVQGNAFRLRNNGRIEGLRFADPGVYRLDVYARGVLASGLGPRMQVDVDGRALSGGITVNNTGAPLPYSVYFEIDGGPTTVGVRYTNDLGTRELFIDKVILTRLDNLPANRLVIEGEKMAISPANAGVVQGSFLKLTSTGLAFITQTIDPGTYRIEVYARGIPGSGIAPRMQVSVNGRALNTPVNVGDNNSTFLPYGFSNIALGGSTFIGIRLMPGLAGRALLLDRVILRRM